MIEQVRTEATFSRVKCDRCGHVDPEQLAFGPDAARAGADGRGWLFDGEDDWCPKCLDELTGEVP